MGSPASDQKSDAPLTSAKGMMKPVTLTVPELGLVVGTRAALGAGLALLLGDRLNPEQRRSVGWTLVAVGVVTTVPLLMEVFGKRPATPHLHLERGR
jgi:hypothetical protein